MNHIELSLVFFISLTISAFYLECLVHLHLMDTDIVGYNSKFLLHFQIDTASSLISFTSF